MATGNDNYLDIYRNFFDNFATSLNPHDQLPVKLASYKLNNDEITGGVVDWTLQYLNQKHCPSSLTAILTRIVIDEIKQTCKNQPAACGYNADLKAYEPLKLMKSVMLKVNEVCLRYLDNSELYSLRSYPSLQQPYHAPIVSTFAIKNTRRFMEDRYVYVDDLNTVFGVQDTDGPSSYYAIFDGHAGVEAAAYSAAHLHQYLAESLYYPTNPERALREAFVRTDAAFVQKAQQEDLNSGTTVVCALYRPKQNKLYVAWVGDSLALLANHGSILQIVKAHRPSRIDEKERIIEMGGLVTSWTGGVWRVDGSLAISRAIGDAKYKPYVTGDPDIAAVPLNGGEDFLIVASDGLWDCVSEDQAAAFVYRHIFDNPDDTACISKNLVHLAREEGSSDNISVIVVFLRDPHQIATTPLPQNIATWHNLQVPDSPNRNGGTGNNQQHQQSSTTTDNNMDLELESTLDNSNNKTNNPFMINNSNQKDVTVTTNPACLFDDILNKHQNGTNEDASPDLFYNNDNNKVTPNTNGKRASSFDDYGEDYEDEEDRSDDFGPETDVDAVDEGQAHHVTISPTMIAAKQLADGIVNNNPFGDDESKSQPYAESDQDDDDISDELMIQKDVNDDGEFVVVTNEFDEKCYETRNTHDNSATPPIGAVLDNSGCVATDNVAESGEDTDDEEWSYLRGDKNNAIENCQDNHIISDDNIITDDQDMSQLNPNAAEFVPVSPVRNAHDITPLTPPNCKNLRDEDSLIAQSPQQPAPMAPTVPNSVESFICEIRERPGDNEDDFSSTTESNKDDEINGHPIIDHQQNSTHSTLETILNGKNVDEIEFHPKLTTGFLSNESIIPGVEIINESLNVSESLSTKAVYGDDTKNYTASDYTDDTNISDIKQDPMSMSFYQDKDAEGNDLGTNPFDLNAVQRIPDNLDEFIGEEQKADEVEQALDFIGEVEAALKSNDDFEEKEQESPMEDKFNNEFESHEKAEEPRSPIPDNDAVLQEQVLNFNEQTVPAPAVADVCTLASNPLEAQDEDQLEASSLQKSPSLPEVGEVGYVSDPYVEDQHEPEPVTASPLPDFEIESPAPDVELTPELLSSKSPDIGLSDDVAKLSVDVVSPGEEMISKSPEIDSTAEIDSKSDVISPAEEVLAKSPDVLQSPVHEHQNIGSPSPIPDDRIESPEVAVEAESTAEITSPVPEKETNEEKETNLEKDDLVEHQIDDFAQEEAQLIQEAQSPEPIAKSPVPEIAISPLNDLVENQELSASSPAGEYVAASPIPEPSESSVPPKSPTPEPAVASLITEPEIAASPIPEPAAASPMPQALSPEPIASPVCSPSPVPDIVQEVEHIPTHVEPDHHEIPEACDQFPAETVPSPIPSQQSANDEIVLETHNYDTFTSQPIEYEERQEEKVLHLEEATPAVEAQNAFSPDEFDQEIKSTETPPPTPALNLAEPALISTSPEPNKLVEAVEKISEEQNVINEVEAAVIAGAVAAGAAAAATAAVASKSPKPEKKPLKATSSPAKAAPAKKPLASTTRTSTPSKPTTLSKSSASPAKPLSSPRVPLAAKASPRSASTTTAPKPIAKKPLTNGDVKPATKTSSSAPAASRPVSAAAKSTTASRLGSAPTKTSPTSTRPPISRPTSAKPSAPATKPSTTTAAPKPRTTLTTSTRTPLTNGVSPKPAAAKTNSVAAKTTSTLSATKTSTTASRSLSKPSTASSTTSSTLSSRPAAPRVSSLTAKKSPLVEKTQKDTTNKQLSATRTTQSSTLTTVKRTTNVLKPKTATTTGTTNSTSSTLVKKTETKSPLLNKATSNNNATSKVGSRPSTGTSTTLNSNSKSTVTRTSTTTKKLPGVTRTTITKTHTTSQSSNPIVAPIEQNQTVTLVHEITNPSTEVEEFIQHIHATELGVNTDSIQFGFNHDTLIRIHAEFQMKRPRYFYNLQKHYLCQIKKKKAHKIKAEKLTWLVDKTVQTDLSDHDDNNYNSNSILLTAYSNIERQAEQDDENVFYQEVIRECGLFLEYNTHLVEIITTNSEIDLGQDSVVDDVIDKQVESISKNS